MRAAKTSKLVSSVAIVGLIVFSILIVSFLNSSNILSPTRTRTLESGAPNKNQGPTGTLIVRLLSNQNESERLSNPTNQSLAVGGKAMVVSQAINSSIPFRKVLVTDASGVASQHLPPGPYVVNLSDEALDINIRVQISTGNETRLNVTIYGTAYPLVFSEESGVRPSAGGSHSDVFVELRTSTSIANVSDPVILKVRGTAPGAGYLVNATVVSSQPPIQGTQWLELGAEVSVDPVNATSIVLTTWTYSWSITVQPSGSFAAANV